MRVNGDIVIISRSRNLAKQKANSEDKYFNYGKLSYWGRKCTLIEHQEQKKNKNKFTTDLSN